MLEKLKNIMENKGITPYRLAKITGIANQDIYAVIGGKKPLYPGWRKRIAAALGVPEAELFDDESEEV